MRPSPSAQSSQITSKEPRPRGSAKGVDARRQTMKELTDPSGGALDIAPVLRVFLRSGLPRAVRTQKRSSIQILKRLPELLLRVHHNRPVPGNRLAQRLA